METSTIALFGEAEKGEYQQGFFCKELTDLLELFGNPPPDSKGLYYATQALLFHYPLVYFRVEEEGFSTQDYLKGLNILNQSPLISSISAICTPGVGDRTIINAILPICYANHQILITNESDLFDYLSEAG